MKLSNIKSNPYYHFVEVHDTSSEILEMQNWCTTTFGLKHSHLWDIEHITIGYDRFQSITSRYIIYRFRFAKIEHRDWFIVRWS